MKLLITYGMHSNELYYGKDLHVEHIKKFGPSQKKLFFRAFDEHTGRTKHHQEINAGKQVINWIEEIKPDIFIDLHHGLLDQEGVKELEGKIKDENVPEQERNLAQIHLAPFWIHYFNFGLNTQLLEYLKNRFGDYLNYPNEQGRARLYDKEIRAEILFNNSLNQFTKRGISYITTESILFGDKDPVEKNNRYFFTLSKLSEFFENLRQHR